MKAVVMAGGEGTRLRPMTASMPKPLLPVANRPIMEHVLRLLKRHGLSETVVTVQFLASAIKNYFGDGTELDMELTYADEEKPLGTAGSVKNVEGALADETFLVISGDALTDFDLTELIRFHKEKNALVTVCLARVPNPLEFGITIADDDGRVERFLEKPTWGQVFSDTVNTGIYVMEPEIFQYVAPDEPVDWSGDVFPRLLAEGRPVYGHVADGYWEDVGTHESYLKAQADALDGKVDLEIGGFELSPGIWVGEGVEVSPDAVLHGPLSIGDYSKIEAGAEVHEHTVIGSNVVVRSGASLHRAVLHNNVYVGGQSHLRGCVIGRNTDVMRAAHIEEGAVIGNDAVIGDEAFIAAHVRVYPSKIIEASAVVNTSVIWESRSHARLFGPRGVSGILNVEITPELAVRVGSAYATMLRKNTTVTVARDHSRGARALKRAMVSALQAAGVDVHDLENVPLSVARRRTARGSEGGIYLRTTAGVADSVDILFFDESGFDLSQAGRRRLDRIYARQEYRRAFPGEIGDLRFPSSVFDSYADAVLESADTSGIREAGPKVVIDAANGSAGLVLPHLLGPLGIDALTINSGVEEIRPTATPGEHEAGLARLAGLVASSRAVLGVRFDPVGERISLVDEQGRVIPHDRALLMFLDLVAAERPGSRIVLPFNTSRVAEQLASRHGVEIVRGGISPAEMARATHDSGAVFAGDGRGGFTAPSHSGLFDGPAALVRLIGLVVRSGAPLGQVHDRIPDTHVRYKDIATPWADKGRVMRAVVEAAGSRTVDTTSDGVHVAELHGQWVVVLPDPSDPVTRVWAEGLDRAATDRLLERWAGEVRTAVA